METIHGQERDARGVGIAAGGAAAGLAGRPAYALTCCSYRRGMRGREGHVSVDGDSGHSDDTAQTGDDAANYLVGSASRNVVAALM